MAGGRVEDLNQSLRVAYIALRLSWPDKELQRGLPTVCLFHHLIRPVALNQAMALQLIEVVKSVDTC
jgi:hypothetical protein